MERRRWSVRISTAIGLALLLLQCSAQDAGGKPNIMYILTDDQDVTMGSLDFMPHVTRLFREEGTEFVNFFCSTALCCPSRVSILRGQYCHNTGIFDNGDNSGGLKAFIDRGLDKETAATIMQDAGYETFFLGKYLNRYFDINASYVPPGWDHWYALTTERYYGAHFSEDGALVSLPLYVYMTDNLLEKALELLEARNASKPFFMYLAPYAVHTPATPAPRHAHLFKDLQAPRPPSFNPPDDVQIQKPAWIRNLPLLPEEAITNLDSHFRNRVRALQAVDEMVLNLTDYLAKDGTTNNTYVMYTTDNAVHSGHFRMPSGKRMAYDTDIRVPFLVRGPGVKKARKVAEVGATIDTLATWIDFAGALEPSYPMDGISLKPLILDEGKISTDSTNVSVHSAVVAEFYGGSSQLSGDVYLQMNDNTFKFSRFWTNTFQAVRVINGSDWATGANWLYAEWCTGEREFYNVSSDVHQTVNLVNRTSSNFVSMLSELLKELRNCTGTACSYVDYGRIRHLVDQPSFVPEIEIIPCMNAPPSAGSMGLSLVDVEGLFLNNTFRGLNDQECQKMVDQGFPYADDFPVPDHVMKVWHACVELDHNVTSAPGLIPTG